DLERGARRSPYPATLRRLADALGVDDAARMALLMTARGPRVALPRPASTRSRSAHTGLDDETSRIVAGPAALSAELQHSRTPSLERRYVRCSDGAATAHGVAGRAALIGGARGVAAPARSSLPIQLTSFIGRQSELAAIASLLDTRPLVTLIGPGGVGKTRL